PVAPQSRSRQGAADATQKGSRPNSTLDLPGPQSSRRGLCAQVGRQAPQHPSPHPENRRLERNLRPGKSRSCPARRLGLPGLRLRVHREYPRTKGATRCPAGRFAPDPPPRPAGTGSAPRRPHALRTQTKLMKPNPSLLSQHLDYLKLPFVQRHHAELAQQSAGQHWDHVEYLRRLVEGEYTERRQRVIERRIKAARFPHIKNLEQFRWDWPNKINRLHVQKLFRLVFLPQNANVSILVPVVRG